MRWIGLNGGYVSGDGRFLVAQVTVKGRRGDVQKWALYGLVEFSSSADPLHVGWGWSDRPLHGPKDLKRECQDWAAASDYQPPEVESGDQETPLSSPIKRIAWTACQECDVDYPRPPGYPYADYCGDNCFTIVAERVEEIRENIRRRTA